MEDNSLRSLVRFLVVDDSNFIRKVIMRSLRHEGFMGTVYEASDGLEALNTFYEKEVDCIICDWNMPKLNGIDFVMKIRQDTFSRKMNKLMLKIQKKKISPENTAQPQQPKPFQPPQL